MTRILVIAGEASGDLHGAGVVRELKRREPSVEIFGVGGDRMIAAGMDAIFHVRELAVMGFFEVVKHLPVLRAVERTLMAVVRGKKPDVVLLIDYPGFNLRFARKVRGTGTKIAYYISPQVWAWNPGRVRKMKGLIDRMLVILPFEERIYTEAGIDAAFVGHPLLEELTEPQERGAFCKRYDLDRDRPILGILPGSRKQEIERIFPAMLGAARVLASRHGIQPVVGVSSLLEFEFMKGFIRQGSPVRLLQNATYDIMKNSGVALVTSGTATLETGWFGTPMVVVYKTSWPTYLIGRMLVRLKNIGLVNIVAGARVVPELIQGGVNPARIAAEAEKFILDPGLHRKTASDLGIIRELLGTPGASGRVAAALLGMA
ncbi:MAG TPA: lipid-A-disaccharide synthase [Bacteroidota bacterium]|nr:lipid-A-disaccharide synthase [Bacteroidota bacterium]